MEFFPEELSNQELKLHEYVLSQGNQQAKRESFEILSRHNLQNNHYGRLNRVLEIGLQAGVTKEQDSKNIWQEVVSSIIQNNPLDHHTIFQTTFQVAESSTAPKSLKSYCAEVLEFRGMAMTYAMLHKIPMGSNVRVQLKSKNHTSPGLAAASQIVFGMDHPYDISDHSFEMNEAIFPHMEFYFDRRGKEIDQHPPLGKDNAYFFNALNKSRQGEVEELERKFPEELHEEKRILLTYAAFQRLRRYRKRFQSWSPSSTFEKDHPGYQKLLEYQPLEKLVAIHISIDQATTELPEILNQPLTYERFLTSIDENNLFNGLMGPYSEAVKNHLNSYVASKLDKDPGQTFSKHNYPY